MNKIIIIGRLTANPESRYVDTERGSQTVCSFSVAVNRKYRNQDITEYFRVSCWNRQAENVMKYLHKGSQVCVTGPVSARAYAGNDGTLRANMEIQASEIEFLSTGSGNAGSQAGQAPPTQQQAQAPQQGTYGQQQSYNPPMDQAAEEGFMQIPDGIGNEGLPFN